MVCFTPEPGSLGVARSPRLVETSRDYPANYAVQIPRQSACRFRRATYRTGGLDTLIDLADGSTNRRTFLIAVVATCGGGVASGIVSIDRPTGVRLATLDPSFACSAYASPPAPLAMLVGYEHRSWRGGGQSCRSDWRPLRHRTEHRVVVGDLRLAAGGTVRDGGHRPRERHRPH